MNRFLSERPRLLAHRGSWRRAPENTLGAFDLALEEGAQGLELDVRCTKDGVPVVFHDRDLLRMCGREDKISSLTWREISEIRIGDYSIPTLEEVLERYRGKALLDIELKGEREGDPTLLESVLRVVRRSSSLDEVLISSFDPFLSASWRKRGGASALIVSELSPDEAPFLPGHFDAVVARWEGIDPQALGILLNEGVPLYAWTINDLPTARKALEWGVWGILTDDPLALRGVGES